jgi:hypothetical protein
MLKLNQSNSPLKFSKEQYLDRTTAGQYAQGQKKISKSRNVPVPDREGWTVVMTRKTKKIFYDRVNKFEDAKKKGDRLGTLEAALVLYQVETPKENAIQFGYGGLKIVSKSINPNRDKPFFPKNPNNPLGDRTNKQGKKPQNPEFNPSKRR